MSSGVGRPSVVSSEDSLVTPTKNPGKGPHRTDTGEENAGAVQLPVHAPRPSPGPFQVGGTP